MKGGIGNYKPILKVSTIVRAVLEEELQSQPQNENFSEGSYSARTANGQRPDLRLQLSSAGTNN